MIEFSDYIQSPCSRDCKIEDKICVSCYRNISEIKEWHSLDTNGKRYILKKCDIRKDKC